MLGNAERVALLVDTWIRTLGYRASLASWHHYRNPWLCQELASLPRVKQKTLGKEGFAESKKKNSRQRKNTHQSGFFAESLLKNSQQRNKHSAQISLPRAK
jgi:hypothetical protein